MRHIVPVIWESIGVIVASGDRIDVDAICQEFLELYPHVALAQIEAVILAAVKAQGGTTV